jgi:hypothetical protein
LEACATATPSRNHFRKKIKLMLAIAAAAIHRRTNVAGCDQIDHHALRCCAQRTAIRVEKLCAAQRNAGGTMTTSAASPDQSTQTTDRLHPLVHIAAAGLLVWFVMAAWLLFGGAGYIELALTMVSVLVFMAIAIPAALWRTNVRAARRSAVEADASQNALEPSPPLRTWLRGRFATWTDQEKGSLAAIEILLPLAAVAFGLTALGIVLDLTRAGIV